MQSLLAAMPAFTRDGNTVEFILADDHSDDAHAVVPVIRGFAAAIRATGNDGVRAMRFCRQVHYAHGLAYTFSLARGEEIFFLSHDMIVTPDCVDELRAVSSASPSIGVIRPTSAHMDWAGACKFKPSQPPKTIEDVFAISSQVRGEFPGQMTDWPMLIGDAMWVRRAVIDRIGVFDTGFYGFWADIDYGVRLYRAGFRHAIARGAWLHHEGNGAAKEAALSGGRPLQENQLEMITHVNAAYERFRQKWDPSLPPAFRDMRRHHFDRLNKPPASPVASDFQPQIPPPSDLVEEL
jgi:hypothetical protein